MDMPYTDQAAARIGATNHPRTTPQWRDFLRALASQIDEAMDSGSRNRMLRAVGTQMATLMPLLPVDSLDALEIEMNEAVAAIGWGTVTVRLDEADRALALSHDRLPSIGAAGDPPGTWLAPVLEGLYETWLASQPGSAPGLTARVEGVRGRGALILRYSRESARNA